ncbi:hypothetical protein [uncultured Parabacteroides sp.]|uniref:hypothetical protein n=1 Tax=uncultured Parabacteroides sp. TaxID=512312 RepID=UPI002659183C|nr:hypothetical protein [uncultured Parabacteroides sp.]
MRNGLLLTLFVIFFSCHDDRTIPHLLDRAESFVETQPDSAEIFLDSIQTPDKLNDKLFARWCFLQSKTADKLHKDMPYVEQLSRALQWYTKHGTAKQQAWIGLYLGRSYAEDKLFIPATNAYSDALEIALKGHIYNVAGYLCSYMADLYTYTGQRSEERRKFEEAAKYFKKAGNIRSYAFALRDIAQTWVFGDSCSIALDYMLKADSIITKLNDSIGMASIANGFGNIYKKTGELNKAKLFFMKSIALYSAKAAPNFLALSNIYYRNGFIDSARYYLEKSKNLTTNPYTHVDRLYIGYLIEKDDNETDNALNYLEQYIEAKDSLYDKEMQIDIIDAEKRHNLAVLSKQYKDLQIAEYFYIILLCFSAIIILTIYLIYQAKNNYQRKVLEQKGIRLNELEFEIQQKNLRLEDTEDLKAEAQKTKEELCALRHNTFQAASITKRIKKLCKNVIPDKEQKLTDKDWNSLIALIQMLYPNVTTFIKENPYSLTDTEKKICYLSFLQLDVKAEAILLDITPNSVSKYRFRARQKLNLANQDTSIYDYLITC